MPVEEEILKTPVELETPVAEIAEQREEETQPEAAAEPEVYAEVPGQLIFEFKGRCWAEVRDVTGKAHIIGEKRAGYRRVIESNLGPFKVTLGDVRMVELTLNGEPYDLSPHTKGNVARFTLETAR